MLNLTQLGRIRKIHNAYIHFHLLDSFLDGISDQRHRIKKADTMLTIQQRTLRSSDASRETVEELFRIQKALFREIRVFFWWWHSAYTTLWTGEKRKIAEPKTFIKIGPIRIQKIAQYKNTTPLVQQLDQAFGKAIERHRDIVRGFSSVRHDLEHILERVDDGEGNLGNLSSAGNRREFLFGPKKIDISDVALDRIDSLAADINHWLTSDPHT